MSKVLVVYYTYSGNARRLAQRLCSMQGWTLSEVLERQPARRGTWRYVLESLLRRQPPIRYDGPAPEDFDTVVLVAPIWAYQLASPMRSFVTQYRERLREVAVISTMGERGAPNAVAEIGRRLGRSPSLSTAFLAGEVQDGSCAGRLQAFGDAVRASGATPQALRPATLSPLEA
jgi:hypothetical protein